jgi:salicylate hydroxylase
MFPFFAQGAAQAIEDGATLAACLAEADDPGAALRRYERVRLPRATRVQALSSDNKTRFHLPDGPEQRARDEAMAAGGTDFSYRAVSGSTTTTRRPSIRCRRGDGRLRRGRRCRDGRAAG